MNITLILFLTRTLRLNLTLESRALNVIIKINNYLERLIYAVFVMGSKINIYVTEIFKLFGAQTRVAEINSKAYGESRLIKTSPFKLYSKVYKGTIKFSQVRFFSSTKTIKSSEFPLNPWFITGFSDGESSFMIRLRKSSSASTGWNIQAAFQINLHQRDILLLESIRSYWGGVGNIRKISPGMVGFVVTSLKDLKVIIEHFDTYPLITQKKADYLLFKQAVEILLNKGHLSVNYPEEGIRKIVALRAALNKGLTNELAVAFPNITSTERPLIIDQVIPSAYWVSGFTCAEGCFIIYVLSNGYCGLKLTITQHSKEEQLMGRLAEFFGCGKSYKRPGTEIVDYLCSKFKYIDEKIIPFYLEYPLLGLKQEDFKDWEEAAKLMKNKEHLKPEGKAKILELKSGMNKGRLSI